MNSLPFSSKIVFIFFLPPPYPMKFICCEGKWKDGVKKRLELPHLFCPSTLLYGLYFVRYSWLLVCLYVCVCRILNQCVERTRSEKFLNCFLFTDFFFLRCPSSAIACLYMHCSFNAIGVTNNSTSDINSTLPTNPTFWAIHELWYTTHIYFDIACPTWLLLLSVFFFVVCLFAFAPAAFMCTLALIFASWITNFVPLTVNPIAI